MTAYEGEFWNKCIFAFVFNAIWMMIETLSGYVLLSYCNKFTHLHVCLILGNLLENAVEAAEKVNEKKYIKIQIKYDKNNLLIFVMNNYKGKLEITKDKRVKSTKLDIENHGVGLPSVYRVVSKYHGTVVIDDSVPERFLIRVVLYGEKE